MWGEDEGDPGFKSWLKAYPGRPDADNATARLAGKASGDKKLPDRGGLDDYVSYFRNKNASAAIIRLVSSSSWPPSRSISKLPLPGNDIEMTSWFESWSNGPMCQPTSWYHTT